jgi:tetratricopeptide (TPR) repeat protein
MAESPPNRLIEPPHIGSSAEILSRALERLNAGAYIEAEDICRQVVLQQPNNAAAWHLRAIAAERCQRMDLAVQAIAQAVTLDPENITYARTMAEQLGVADLAAEAVSAWRHVVALNPDDAQAHLHLATHLLQIEQTPEALDHYQQAANLRPDDIPFQYMCATSLAKNGQHEAAIIWFETVLEHEPENADAIYNLARELHSCGRLAAAIERYKQAVALRAEWPQAHNNLSVVLREVKQIEDAIAHGERAIAAQPDYPLAHNNLGLALLDAGRFAEGAAQLEKAVSQRPDDLEIQNNLAVALNACGRSEEAMKYANTVLRERPEWSVGRRTRGNILRQMNRLEEAVAEFQAGLSGQSPDFELYGNLGLTLLNLGKPNEAAAVYEKALALSPDQPEIRTALGIAQLSVGDFDSGWANYEHRWRCADFAPAKREFSAPRWEGDSLEGKRILVFAEQGYGDTLQFCRYLPIVKDYAAHVIFECQPSLTQLMETLGSDVTIVPRGQPQPKVDVQAPLLSLPLLLQTWCNTIPSDIPYLMPPNEIRKRREHFVGDSEPIKIGIAWAGNSERQDDWMRSCPPDQLRPIFDVANTEFFSLQKGVDISVLPPDVPVTDLAPDLTNFSDTAAAIADLDLVITVDTAVAHLAGALGARVWVMLGNAPDWRYMRERDDSPWYPTMRLFRQNRVGGWKSTALLIAEELNKFVARRTT